MTVKLSSSGFTHTGAVREHNEDAFLALPEIGLWVVADGMGGHEAGDVASQLVCDTVTSQHHKQGGALAVAELEEAFELANQRILQYVETQLPGATMGSTMAALRISDARYQVLWIGDSRVYLLRQGQLRQLSRDHSQVADLVDQGVLAEDEAEKHPLANVITRALGVEATPAIDLVEGEVRAGDRFFLCSDGISREFGAEELTTLLRGEPIDDVNMALRHSALVKGCKDNITSIIVQVEAAHAMNELGDPQDDATLPLGLGNL
ncbi:protein phosphatase 2C domain-containing protein [Marinobacteraceae bacterium S3BR75-40.1]